MSLPSAAVLRRVKSLFRWVLAAILLAWLVRAGKFATLAQLELGWTIGAMLLLQLLSIVFGVARWRILTKAAGVPLTTREVYQISCIGYFATIFLPSTGGTEAVRLFYAVPRTKDHLAQLIGSLVADRLIGVVCLFLVAFVCSMVLLLQIESEVLYLFSVRVASATALVIAVLLLVFRIPLQSMLDHARRHWLVGKVLDVLVLYRNAQGAVFVAFLYSVGCQCASVPLMFLAFKSFGAEVPPVIAFCLSPLIGVLTLIPLTPMGLGVTDSVSLALFGALQISGGAEATMVVRLMTIPVLCILGIAYLVPLPPGPSERKTQLSTSL